MMNFDYQTYGFFGPFFMLMFWVIVILGIIAFVRWSMGQTSGAERKKEDTALEILKERYAKGEIDKKEFEEKKKSLMS